jgi:peroxiredoxin
MNGYCTRNLSWGCLLLAVVGCGSAPPPPSDKVDIKKLYGSYGPAPVSVDVFHDKPTNAQTKRGEVPLKFIDSTGKPQDLSTFHGKKPIVCVYMRGFSGAGLCPYCTAQTASFIKNYAEFTKRGAELLVVFPGSSDKVSDYVAAAQNQADKIMMPFPVLLDADFKAVDQLGIRGDLAKPSTYILNKDGDVVFAYVGSTLTDRPSLKSIFSQLDRQAAKP